MEINVEKISLAALPTPIVKLEKLSKMLGKNIWIKRDDFTGIECSGNKVRKLEYIFKEVLDQGYDVVLTCGGIQSNHCRATASAAAKLGVKCILFLSGEKKEAATGNLLLDYLFGADVRFVPEKEFDHVQKMMEAEAERLDKTGQKAYVIPLGASNTLGAMGYLECYREICDFEKKNQVAFDAILLSVGSGGTYAGMRAGSRMNGDKHAVYGINVSGDEQYFVDAIYRISEKFDSEYHLNTAIRREDIHIIDGYVGEGYGIASAEVVEFIKQLARTEGIIVDPVYTGKAFHGLAEEIKKGSFDGCQNILFVHTGGLYGIFGQAEIFGC